MAEGIHRVLVYINISKTLTLRDDEKYDIQKFEYDAMNRITKDIKLADKEDIFNTSGMEGYGNLIDSKYPDKLALVTAYEYDILGNLIKETQPKAFEYALENNENREQYTIHYSYDELNRLERITRKHDGTDVHTTYQYDELGNRMQAMDELGHVTQYAYDSMNRLLASTDAMGNTYRYAYDLAGNKISEMNANGYAMSYSYDKLNRLETVTDPYHVVVETNAYDANGNLIESRDARGNATKYAYDLANKVIKMTDPEAEALGGFTASYEYNQYGEKIKETDGLGNATGYEYDRAGRLIKVTDALGISTLYTYVKAGNKLSMTDGRGKTTNYGYGAFGMLKSMTDADNQTMHYAYDLSGNTACVTDRNGNMLIHTYNNRGLVTERISVDTGESIQYSYGYSYDPLNRLIRVNKNNTLQLAYTYDDIGNIESVTDSKGFKTSYGYDKASRLETVTFNGRITEYKYDVCGNREAVTYEGGVKEEYSYDKNNRLLKLTNRKPDNSVVSQYSYTYDITGRETSKTDSYGTTNYTYDQAGRVLKVEAPGKITVYGYDKTGNRISLRETYTSNQPTKFIDEATKNEVEYILKTSQYVYSDTNRLVKLVEEMYSADNTKVLTKTIQYIYDANGNEVSNYASFIHPDGESLKRILEASVHGENQPTGPSSLIERNLNTFDGFNRLKKVEDIGSGVRTLVEYTYNGDDLRVSKTVKSSDKNYSPEITNFLYDRQHVILETDETNAVRTRYVRGINYIARYNNGSELNYFLFNGHGDTVQTITEDGEVQNQYDYDIFGNPTLTIEISACSIRYAGEYLDKETGLYYLRARYYRPYTGRFISEDSYWGEDNNPLSLNLYTYCFNNPIKYCDPTGHWVAGDEKLNDDAKANIIALGNAWQAATTQDERDRIHQQAQDIRKNQDSWQTVDSNGNLAKKDTLVQINNVSSFDSAMIAAMSDDGIISKEENQNAQKLIGATTTSIRTAGTSLSPDVAVTVFSSTTIIGKSDININIKTAQSLKNTNMITTGPANIDITNHYSAYFFYNPRWTDQYEQNLDYLADYYGIDKSDIGTAAIGTDPVPKGANGTEFADAWNSIGNAYDGKNVRAAVVFNHGRPSGIESIENPQIQKLDSKNIDNLLLLNCNAGHLDHVGNNPASYFAEKINGGKVMASDGTLLSGMNQKLDSGKGDQYWRSLNDEDFASFIPDSKKWWFFHRNNKGFVIYQFINGQLTTSNTGNKKLSIRQMLDLMK